MTNNRNHTKATFGAAELDATRRVASRRRFLRLSGAGLLTGAAAVAGMGAADRLARVAAGEPTDATAYVQRADVDAGDRILVMVQLAGGLDFLNTIVPRTGRYRDVRTAGAVAEAGLLPLDADFGFHPMLPNLSTSWSNGELAIVHGVGLPENSLSHFVDTDAWTRGRMEVGDGTGWLGRTLDGLATDVDPLIGISVGSLTPAMYAPGWNAVALPDDGTLPWTAEFVEQNPGIVAAHQQMLTATGRPGSELSLAQQVRASQQLVRDVADTVGGATDLERLSAVAELYEGEGETPGDDVDSGVLTARLRLVADLINGGLPTRAYHVEFGDFDTHADQAASFPLLLGELDSAIAGFRAALGPNADKVVIATWTEFGRRPDWNGSGTDHGTAGTHLVLGAGVNGGHHGEHVSLDRFDRDDNFVVTTNFDRYLGGLAQSVLGVEASRAVPGTTNPMELIQS